MPGATHLFEEPGALEAVACLAADWFRRHFRTRSEATDSTVFPIPHAPELTYQRHLSEPDRSRPAPGRETEALRESAKRNRARAAARRRAGGVRGGQGAARAARCFRRAEARHARPSRTGHGRHRHRRRPRAQ